MKTLFELKSLFAFSQKNQKSAYYEFGPGINIIYGRNTSGKSSVIKAILFTLGINDGKDQLNDILQEEAVLRIDANLKINGKTTEVTFIRDGEILFFKRGDSPIISFSGILSDVSAEHVKLKRFLSELFGFELQLESNNEYKPAPLEAMLLPYYVSQAVGWVYLRKSFSNLDFYRNFKDDYLDYYLGIENFSDRIQKHKLEARRSELQKEQTFYANMQKQDIDLQVTELLDETFTQVSQSYFESHKTRQEELLKKEREYLQECNNLAYYRQRKSVLSRIASNLRHQDPANGKCPTCTQSLPNTIIAQYNFLQDSNDTEREIKFYNDEIKTSQSKINSLNKQIKEARSEITLQYEVLKRVNQEEISLDTWLKNKANTKLISNVTVKLGTLSAEIEDISNKLKGFKDEDEIQKMRVLKSRQFLDIFKAYLSFLGVKEPTEERYTSLYKISAFPYQGVELLKTLMSYHFAFNYLIGETNDIHRFPFLLDAIFKEDMTNQSKDLIIKFIARNRLKDTQVIMTISQDAGQRAEIDNYNARNFNGTATLVMVGGGLEERSFMRSHEAKYDALLQETLALMQAEN